MQKELLSKQLIYRSSHRGCKETDFLIGNFVEENLAKMSEENQLLLANFLQEDDLKIYDWILGKEEAPEVYLALVESMKKFHNI